jgi:hypothetical protein
VAFVKVQRILFLIMPRTRSKVAAGTTNVTRREHVTIKYESEVKLENVHDADEEPRKAPASRRVKSENMHDDADEEPRKAPAPASRRVKKETVVKTEQKSHVVVKMEKTSRGAVKTEKSRGAVKAEGARVVVKSEDEPGIKWQPGNWRQVYENIREMRKNFNAPVDDMGCEQCADITADAKVFTFYIS